MNKYDKESKKFHLNDVKDFLEKISERENIYICSRISASTENYWINLMFDKILELIIPDLKSPSYEANKLSNCIATLHLL